MINKALEFVGLKLPWNRSDNKEVWSQNAFKQFFTPRNIRIDGPLLAYAYRAVQNNPNQSLFDLAGIAKTPETTLSLIANLSRTNLADTFPSALDADKEPKWHEMRNYVGGGVGREEHELNVFLHGFNDETKQRFDHDVHSLGRHLDRAPTLSKIYIEGILEKQGILFGDSKYFVEGIADLSLQKFADEHLGGLHPFHLPVVLRYHDYARHIDQSSTHDALVKPLVGEIGLIPSIVRSFHEPVPCDIPIPDDYDNGAQMLSRLADNFGKVEWKEGYGYRLRRSIEAMCAYSRERQEKYFNDEHMVSGTFWFGKSNDNLELYLSNEKLAYEKAANWFKSMSGYDFERFMAYVDNHSEEFGMYRS